MTVTNYRVAVLTVGRSDFSILLPLLHKLQSAPDVLLGLIVAGGHFDPAGGMTISEVHASDIPIWGQFDHGNFEKTALGSGCTMGDTTKAAAQILAELNLDLLVILGDRFEALAFGLAAIPHGVRIAHISGGSITRGATDDVYRHCLSKMAHIHFCDIPEFADRIIRMGEQPDFVFPHGALGIDALAAAEPVPLQDLCEHFQLPSIFRSGFALLNLHSETQNLSSGAELASQIIKALEVDGLPVLATAPNADPGAEVIRRAITATCQSHDHWAYVPHLGAKYFASTMGHAQFMIGNSSSGIIEAATMKLPVINVGDRQEGRYTGRNVFHVEARAADISQAITVLRSRDFQAALNTLENPYGEGDVGEKILESLRSLAFGRRVPLAKHFYDGPQKNS